jgi:Acyl-CoA carboxylase epsilon subunit
MAAGRVLGAGPPRVRRAARVMTAGEPEFRVMTAGEPEFRVMQLDATDEQIAALAVALAAKLAARPARDRGPVGRGAAGRWADRAQSVRAPLTPGPGSWRNSARPG